MGRKIRLYTDEHVAKAVVRGLRQRGVDVLTVLEAGMIGALDEAHIRRAGNEDRVIFTQDDDFLRLHAAGVDHAGIIYAPQPTSVQNIIRGLMLIHQVLDAEEMRGHVEFL
ncbi:DUF5615 family PIN-like protein [Candidatus Methylomirabilis sp.]|uniref:DUF5615 family PIN-like protein n=1 Tax=Candidatus Methylomirabilis sp. TaxID=2032687 RepID=UPI00307639F2